MYKVIVVGPNEVGALERMLNEASDEGYELVLGFESNLRQVLILRMKPKVGRPSKPDKGE